MKIKMSQHILTERADRLMFILSHEDLSNFTILLEQKYPTKRECVTADGVILVKDLQEEFLITAYIATLDKVYAMYASAGLAVPAPLKKKILRNKKKNYIKLQNGT